MSAYVTEALYIVLLQLFRILIPGHQQLLSAYQFIGLGIDYPVIPRLIIVGEI